jgi:hypothetical protein
MLYSRISIIYNYVLLFLDIGGLAVYSLHQHCYIIKDHFSINSGSSSASIYSGDLFFSLDSTIF